MLIMNAGKSNSQLTEAEAVLEAIRQALPANRISAIEQLIIEQAWLGHTYQEMAQGSGYTADYIKEVGSQLWQDLSAALGRRITKKNLHVVLKQPGSSSDSLSTTIVPFRVETRFAAADSSAKPTIAGVSTRAPESLRFPSGALSLDSPFYIEREVEAQIFAELQQLGCLIRLKAPKHFGKTSLLYRLQHFAENQGYQPIYLDFQEADESTFVNLNRFLRWFCLNIARQLSCEPKLDLYWDEEIGSKVSCKMYFERYLLLQIDRPLMLMLDEVNRVFEHPEIAADFLPMLRSWYEQAKQAPIWNKLKLVIAYATEVYIPLNLNQSPFNVGFVAVLSALTIAQTQKLAAQYGLDWRDEDGKQNAVSLRAMVGGHPYLTSLALYHLKQNNTPLETLLQEAPTQAGIYRQHLQSCLALLQNESELATAMHQVVVAPYGTSLDAIMAYKLESLGIVQLEGNRAEPSCELYRRYFQQQLQVQKKSIQSEVTSHE